MILTLIFLSLFSWSHGEDQPGPNGGHIRMPGPFHTEVLTLKNGLKVWLLDMHFKNPETKDSSVEVEYIGKKHKEKIQCKIEAPAFLCNFSKKVRMDEGVVHLIAQRGSHKGNVAVYKLPLKFQ